jgi:hypothetical protein
MNFGRADASWLRRTYNPRYSVALTALIFCGSEVAKLGDYLLKFPGIGHGAKNKESQQ